MSILVLGTVALDTVKTPCGVRKNILGGSAAHFAMAARFFVPVNLVAIVGEDFPKRYIDLLDKKGIVLTSLIKVPGRTFRWVGEYKGDLNTALTITTELGVLSLFKPTLTESQRKIEHVFLANVDPEIQMHLLKSIHTPRLVGCDSMNYWISHKRNQLLRLLKKVDIYVANDAEARSLSGKSNLLDAARKLLCFGPKIVVVKKGEHGLLCVSRRMIFSLPGYPVNEAVDPTGAGDTFAGGFMGYLAKARRIDDGAIRKALVYGTVLASFNVENFGAKRVCNLSNVEIESRIRRFRKVAAF